MTFTTLYINSQYFSCSHSENGHWTLWVQCTYWITRLLVQSKCFHSCFGYGMVLSTERQRNWRNFTETWMSGKLETFQHSFTKISQSKSFIRITANISVQTSPFYTASYLNRENIFTLYFFLQNKMSDLTIQKCDINSLRH